METVTEKNKANANRSNAEERITRRSKAEVEFDWYGIAINAALTMANGALFALGGLAAKSAVDRIRPQQQSQDFLVDGSAGKKQLVGHA